MEQLLQNIDTTFWKCGVLLLYAVLRRNKPEKRFLFELFVTTTFKSIVSALEGYFFYRALVTVFDTERQESFNRH
jgi:hypothetical protein